MTSSVVRRSPGNFSLKTWDVAWLSGTHAAQLAAVQVSEVAVTVADDDQEGVVPSYHLRRDHAKSDAREAHDDGLCTDWIAQRGEWVMGDGQVGDDEAVDATNEETVAMSDLLAVQSCGEWTMWRVM